MRADAALSPGWMTAGAILFVVALSAPVLVLKYMPAINTLDAVRVAEATEAEASPADQVGAFPNYSEVALTAQKDATPDAAMGSLATLIDKQGTDARLSAGPAVRRMVLDAISIDLESSTTVDALDHLRVPMRDCAEPDVWLIDEGPKIGNALHALPSDLGDKTARIAGPGARKLAATHEGIRIEYCADQTRISAVEILPLEPVFDPGSMELVAELEMPDVDAGYGTIPAPAAGSAGVITGQSLRLVPGSAGADSSGMLTASKPARMPLEPDAPKLVATPGLAVVTEDLALAEIQAHPKDVRPSSNVRAKDLAQPEQAIADSAGLASETPAMPEASMPTPLLAFNGDAFRISSDVSLSAGDVTNNDVLLAFLGKTPGRPEPVRSEAGLTLVSASSEAAEKALKLGRKARWRAQLRLALLGYDPRGIDGIFGGGTRNAIASLQKAEALPSTGYLDETTLALLKRKSQRRYTNWLAKRARLQAERLERELAASAPQQVATVPAARRATGCARDDQGVIISNQSFGCDLNVLREGLGSLFGTSG